MSVNNETTDSLKITAADQRLIDFLISQGYRNVKKLSDYEFAAIIPLAYSVSVCCGIDSQTPFKYRWCFKKESDALEFLKEIKEFDDIPSNKDALVGHRYPYGKALIRIKNELGHDKW